jgi:MAF protein
MAIGKDMMVVVLASGSPRREELLKVLGVPFEVVVPQIREDARRDKGVRKLALELAQMKADSVASIRQGEVIVAADTLVVVSGQVMGKPGNETEAWAMLDALRGREHQVTTGLAVVDPSGRASAVQAVETQVWMRDYSDQEIADYIARGEPCDKAGGYAIQDAEFHPADRIHGCYANVVGLPLCHLYLRLEKMGVFPAASPQRACEEYAGHQCVVASQILGRPDH